MNEEAIKLAYDLFVNDGYTKSIEEFKKLMNENSQGRKVAYDLFVNDGYTKDINSFGKLMGVSGQPSQNLAQSLSKDLDRAQGKFVPDGSLTGPVKKKGTTVSSSGGGSSVSQKYNPYQEDLDRAQGKFVPDGPTIAPMKNIDEDKQAETARLKSSIDSYLGLEGPGIKGFSKKYDHILEQAKKSIPEDYIPSKAERKADEEFFARRKKRPSLEDLKIQAKKSISGSSDPYAGTILSSDKDKPQFYKSLESLTNKLLDNSEEFVVPKLNYEYGQYGFTFEETGVGDAMLITASNKKTLRVMLSTFWGFDGNQEASKVRKFLDENKVIPNNVDASIKGLQKVEKKITDESEIIRAVRVLNDQSEYFERQAKEFILLKSKLDKVYTQNNFANLTREKLDNDSELKKKYEQWSAENKILQQNVSKLKSKELELKGKGQKLDYLAGKYNSMKSKQGTVLGGLWNSITEGAGSITANTASMMTDILTSSAANALMGDKYFYGMGKYNYDMETSEVKSKHSTYLKTLNKDEKEKFIHSKVIDKARKEIKYGKEGYENPFSNIAAGTKPNKGIVDYSREGLREVLGDNNTTTQWERLKEEGFWYGAISGLAKSLPAMVGGAGLPGMAQRTALMYSQVSDGINKEMQDNPEFKDISENEKYLISIPVGIAVGALESVGFRNVVGQKGLLNGLVAKAIGQSSKKTTAKTFSEFIKRDVESMVARGVLTVGAAGLAEFETGATQQLAEVGLKEIYNMAKGKDLFQNPETFVDLVSETLYAGLQEAVGGFIMGAPGAVSAAVSERKTSSLSNETLEVFEEMTNDENYKKMYVAKLKNEISERYLTVEEAKDNLAKVNLLLGIMPSIPSDYTTEQKKSALELLFIKKELEKDITGKDPKLVADKQKDLDEVNEKLEGVSSMKSEAKEAIESIEKSELDTDERINKLESMLASDAASMEETGQGELIPEAREEIVSELESLKKTKESTAKPDTTNEVEADATTEAPSKASINEENSSNFANLTEDAEGNFVFFHRGEKGYDKVKKSSGTSKGSKSENIALGKIGGAAMYYTDQNDSESMVDGPAQYSVKVSPDKVYDANSDPLGFREEAKNMHEEEFPGQSFDSNTELAYITKVAGNNGFEMVVSEWNGKSRAQTTSELKPNDVRESKGNIMTKDFSETYVGNRDKGYEAVIPKSKFTKLKALYDKINDIRNKEAMKGMEGRYDELYQLNSSFDKYSQEEITELIDKSDLSQEIKDEYKAIISETPKGRYTYKGKTGTVKIKNAPKGTFLNIGLEIGSGNKSLTEADIVAALPSDVKILNKLEIKKEGGKVDEDTLSAEISRELTDAEMAKLRKLTKQDGIPQISNGKGTMYGNMSAISTWGDFNPEYFIMPDGTKASEQLTKAQKIAKAVRSLKAPIDLRKMSSSPKPIFDAAWNSTLEATARIIEAGGNIAEAVEAGIKALRDSKWYKGLSDKAKKSSEEFLERSLTDEANQLLEEKEINKRREKDLALLEAKEVPDDIQGLDALIKEREDINAIYDAELAALEPTQTSEVESKEAKEKESSGPTTQERRNKILDGIDAKIKGRNVGESTNPKLIMDKALAYFEGSKEYGEMDSTEREDVYREIRKKYGAKEKKSPTAKRILGKLKDIKNITMAEMTLLNQQILDRNRGAKDLKKAQSESKKQLINELKNFEGKGEITTAQMISVISRLEKVDLIDQNSVGSFVDYMADVFSNAEYRKKMSLAKSMSSTARKNIKTKLGQLTGAGSSLNKLFSINPKIIPLSVLDTYMDLVKAFGGKKAVLTVPEISTVKEQMSTIFDAVDEENSTAIVLADRFAESENKVFDKKTGKLNFSESINKMVKEGEIEESEAKLMKKYKGFIVESESKQSMTEAEIEQEKDDLIKEIKSSPVLKISQLSSRLERSLSGRFEKLLTTENLEGISNRDLQNIVKLIDNINNGYVNHLTQVMVEKLTSVGKKQKLKESILKAKILKVTGLYTKIKSKITKKGYISEMIRRNPLFYIDQIFGDYNSTSMYDSIFKDTASAYANYKTQLTRILKRIDVAMDGVAKSFGRDINETLKSSFLQQIYLQQLEHDSNVGNKEVNHAVKHVEKTIGKLDASTKTSKNIEGDILNEILNNKKLFNDEGNFDIEKIYDSFNSAEKKSIKILQEQSALLQEKAIFTAAVIRGKTIIPRDNYVHLNVLSEGLEGEMSSPSEVSNYAKNIKPSTKGKSLIERTGGVSALNFNAYSAASKAAKYVLMDFNLTEPIRVSRRTLSGTIKDIKGDKIRGNTEELKIANAINSAFDEAIENVLMTSYSETSLFDDVLTWMKTNGYRAVLASLPRAAAELSSNMAFAVIANPAALTAGMGLGVKFLTSDKAVNSMMNLNSNQTTKNYPNGGLDSRSVDITSKIDSNSKTLKARTGAGNVISKGYNKTVKRLQDATGNLADKIISTPDKIVAVPLWFGEFSRSFEKATGLKPDFDKISENNEDYMNEYKSELDEATSKADKISVMAGASNNPLSGILKGASQNQSAAMKVFNTFNNYMQTFLIFEYVTARTGVNGLVTGGGVGRKKGAALIGASATRMVSYTLLSKMFSNGMYSILASLFGWDDEEDEDEPTTEESLSNAIASTAISMMLGRDFGNVTKQLINFGVENVNENYLGSMRDGKDYNKYKHSLSYSLIPKDKDGKLSNDLFDYIIAGAGPIAPGIKAIEYAVKKTQEEDIKIDAEKQKENNKKKENIKKKISESNDEKEISVLELILEEIENEEESKLKKINRQQSEKQVRVPLDLLGVMGFIPLYKDVSKVYKKALYNGLSNEIKLSKEEEEKSKEDKAAEKERLGKYGNKTDMKRYDPELYEKTFGEESEFYDKEKLQKEIEKIKREIKADIKDETFNYTPKKDMNKSIGGTPIGGTPIGGTPIGGTSIGGTPIGGTPIGGGN